MSLSASTQTYINSLDTKVFILRYSVHTCFPNEIILSNVCCRLHHLIKFLLHPLYQQRSRHSRRLFSDPSITIGSSRSTSETSWASSQYRLVLRGPGCFSITRSLAPPRRLQQLSERPWTHHWLRLHIYDQGCHVWSLCK